MKLDINVASIKKFRKKIEMMSQVKSVEKIERKKRINLKSWRHQCVERRKQLCLRKCYCIRLNIDRISYNHDEAVPAAYRWHSMTQLLYNIHAIFMRILFKEFLISSVLNYQMVLVKINIFSVRCFSIFVPNWNFQSQPMKGIKTPNIGYELN